MNFSISSITTIHLDRLQFVSVVEGEKNKVTVVLPDHIKASKVSCEQHGNEIVIQGPEGFKVDTKMDPDRSHNPDSKSGKTISATCGHVYVTGLIPSSYAKSEQGQDPIIIKVPHGCNFTLGEIGQMNSTVEIDTLKG